MSFAGRLRGRLVITLAIGLGLATGALLASPELEVKGTSAEASYGSYSAYNRTAVMQTARSYIGTPYSYGALDCSGFTTAVYSNAIGYYLPDSPYLQMGYGYAPAQLLPGDLVFFNEHGYGISHVAIYSGNGMVIHSSTYYGAVVESPMSYIPGYVGARRIL